MMKTIFLLAFGLATHSLQLSASTPVNVDPGFEAKGEWWAKPFIPQDSENSGAAFYFSNQQPHSGEVCAVMAATEDARFAISPKGGRIAVEPGQVIEFSVWIKAGNDFMIKDGTPGFIIRIDYLQGDNTVGKRFIDWEGAATASPPKSAALISSEWTQVQARITTPENADGIRASIFFWRASGSLYLDDFEIIPLDQ
ncbi:hypothetical protein [Cerasicoccus maritimus]|uniref:hypothetical protein n=1 Tax=Cerasicoccus maritimus TaxID=490089 RepID=UPI0028528771|nr:hypothetical protein [Cerasicoccus maritimus]